MTQQAQGTIFTISQNLNCRLMTNLLHHVILYWSSWQRGTMALQH